MTPASLKSKANKKMSYGDSPSYSSSATYFVPSNSKTGSQRPGNVIKDILQSFVADTELEQQLAYEDFEQIEKLDIEKMDLKWQMAILSVRVHKFEQKAGRKIDFDKKKSARFNKKKVRCYKCQQRGHFTRECRAKGGNDKQRYSSFKIKEIGKKEEDSKALITVDTLVDWTYHNGESDEVVASKEFGMIDGCDSEDAIEECAAKIYNLITGADTEEASTAGDAGEFALMGVTSEVHNCPFGCDNKYNELHKQYNELNEKNGEYFKQAQAYKNSLKTLEKQKRENELGWDDSAFSVFATTSKDVEGRPFFNRFAKADSMKAVPPPLSGDYTSLSDHIDLDESQMSYGTKSSTSCDSKFVSNDFVSYDDSDKSSEVNIPPARPQPVPTGKPKVFAPLQTGRLNGPFLVPTDSGYSPSENPFSAAKDERIFDSGCSRNMTDTECLVLSKDFKLLDNIMVVHRVPRKHNLYIINLNNLCPMGNLACLVAHALVDESVKWHRRMGHVNYKNINRLVKGNLVKGQPPKLFKNDHTCVACCKGKQHKASYKAINAVFFLEHKDETYPILKDFINLVENQLNKKVKAIRCDNGIEFKNAHMIELCGSKGIKREYSNARTPQQNRVAERKNRTLIEAARTMLADSKLPTMFWTKAVRTACYVLNRVSITRPHNKTPYALLTRIIPSVSHFKPFGCHVTILNTSDHLGKFDGKADEGYIVGYSASLGHEWYFDLDYLTDTLGYKHVQANQTVGTQGFVTNLAGTQDAASDSDCDEQVIIELARLKGQAQQATSDAKSLGLGFANDAEELQTHASAKIVPPGCIPVPTGNIPVPLGSLPVPTGSIPVAAVNTVVSTDDVPVHTSSSTDSFFDDAPTTRFSSPPDLGNHDPSPAVQTRSKVKQTTTGDSAFICYMYDQQRDNHTNFQHCLFACFLSQVEPRSVAQALKDLSWVDDIQEEMQQFKFQNVWVLIDLPKGKYAIRTKIEAIHLFLSFASYIGFMVYQMDVKSAFLYKRIDEECDEFEALMKGEFQMSAIGELTFFLGLQVQQRPDGIFINQDKYVQEIVNKFDLGSVRTTTTPYEATKPKSKNESDSPVNVHLYRSMIGSLMYLTASRPDIMFAVSACLRNQVTPTTSNLEAVKKIFNDYAGVNKDRKSTTSRCQFLGRRLISWQCKKQTIVSTSFTKAEYVAAANCCGQSNGSRRWISVFQVLYMDQVALFFILVVQVFPLVLPEFLLVVSFLSTLHSDHQPAQNLNHNSTSSMAALRYKDEYNKVGYLLKPTRSDDYHHIIDFLRASHIRSRLQLADDGGIADLPIAEIYFGMDNLGTKSGSWDQFGTPIVVALICLSDGRRFNWSSYIFKRMVKVQRQQTFDPHALVFEHGQSSDPNTASFSRSHETAAGPFINVEDETLGGSFHMSPPRFTQAPPAETELKDHKKLFKDVVGKLVKKVKAMEVKLKTKKRKMVVSDSDQKEGGKQDVDLDALRALANAAVTIDSNISSGGASNHPAASTSVLTAVPTGATAVPVGASTIPPGTLIVPAGSPSVPTAVSPSVAPAGVSNKGKYPMVKQDIHVKARTFKQMEEDRLGEEAAKRLHDEEQAQLDRQRAELQWRRQQEVLDSAMYYTEADWINIKAQMKRQALAEKLAQERQNRPMTQAQQRTYMRHYVKNQSSAVYTTRWTMAYVKSFTDDQLKEEFKNILKVQSNSQIQAFSRTLKRTGPVLEEFSSKRQKSTEAPILYVPEVPQSQAVSSPPSSGTKKKSLGRKRLTKPKSTLQELDLDSDAQTFIKVISNEDSDDEAPPVWSALVGWEDLVKLYGLVVKYYETCPVAVVGLILWGDLQVLFESHEGGKGSVVWQNQHLWDIQSWRLYTLSNFYILETVPGEVLYMFADVSYHLSEKLMEKMLTHKLEIDKDGVGNDMTTAEQLIQLIKNQLVVAQVSSV
nr:hypothetical protein [Tanacetum cinerariifolium]